MNLTYTCYSPPGPLFGRLRDAATGLYLQPDSTWAAPQPPAISLPQTGGVWPGSVVVSFPVPDGVPLLPGRFVVECSRSADVPPFDGFEVTIPPPAKLPPGFSQVGSGA